MTAAKKDNIETPEEKVVREAAELKAANTNPEANQPVEKQASSKREPAPFEGQTVTTDKFSIVTGDNLGRPLVSIRPRNWIGDAPLVIPGYAVKELIGALKQINDLPEEPKLDEVNAGTGGDEEE